MVKITNVFGDEYEGVQDNAIFQKVYGKQVRRKRYTQSKPPSPKQLQVQQRFKDAITWIKTLDPSTKKYIKRYFTDSDLSSTPNFPKTWYTYAKFLYITSPSYKQSSDDLNTYIIKHPALSSIQFLDSLGSVTDSMDNLTDFSIGKITTKYTVTPLETTSRIRIITYPGVVKDIVLLPFTEQLKYYDIKYFDSRYFV